MIPRINYEKLLRSLSDEYYELTGKSVFKSEKHSGQDHVTYIINEISFDSGPRAYMYLSDILIMERKNRRDYV